MKSVFPGLLLLSIFLLAGCSKHVQQVAGPIPPVNAPLPVIEVLNPEAESVFIQHANSDLRVGSRNWQGIPSIAATNDGKQIFVAWYSGGISENPGNYITVALSTTKARTWLNDELVVYPQNPGSVRFFDPSLWRDKYDHIWLTWAKSKSFWDGRGGVWATKLKYDGNAIQNTDVKELTKGVMLNKPANLTNKNYSLLPVSMWDWNTSKTSTLIYKAEYKNNQLNTDLISLVSSIQIPQAIRTFDEPQLAEVTPNGELLCMIRTLKGIYYARSYNYGITWTDAAPFVTAGATCNSRFHLARLKSGKLLLVLNNSSARTDMTALISADGGKTWPGKLLLDNRKNISYPDAVETNDGVIHIVYDRERTTAREILYCRVKEKDILAQNARGIYRSQVNSH